MYQSEVCTYLKRAPTWKSGASAPRKVQKSTRALAPVAVFWVRRALALKKKLRDFGWCSAFSAAVTIASWWSALTA